MPTHLEAPATERAPRVPIAASPERGSVSCSASAPEGQNANSRGCKPTVDHVIAARPRRGRTIHRATIRSTLSGSGEISGTCSVGLHPRLFMLNPFGIHEPALRRIGGRHYECPTGASSFSPGLARPRRDYPGLNEQNSHNPERVVSTSAQANTVPTPLGLLNHFDRLTQGRPQSRPTLGWRTESRWDSFA